MPRMNASCRTCMSHVAFPIRMRHITYDWVMSQSPTWMHHTVYEWVMSHTQDMNESCPTLRESRKMMKRPFNFGPRLPIKIIKMLRFSFLSFFFFLSLVKDDERLQIKTIKVFCSFLSSFFLLFSKMIKMPFNFEPSLLIKIMKMLIFFPWLVVAFLFCNHYFNLFVWLWVDKKGFVLRMLGCCMLCAMLSTVSMSPFVLQRVAACCSVLQCVAVCKILRIVPVTCQCVLYRIVSVTVCCSVLQHVAACCSVFVCTVLRNCASHSVWLCCVCSYMLCVRRVPVV